MLNKVTGFLGNVRAELEKVTWPTRQDTYGSTIIVIVLVLLIAVFLWAVDTGLSTVIRSILPQSL